MAASRRRGFSIIEALVASAILGLALTGTFSLWTGLFSRFTRAREVSQATQLARAEIERAKVYGVDKLPTGTYDAATKKGTWSGSFDSSTGTWVSDTMAYYDLAGNRMANANGAKLRVLGSLKDSDVVLKTGGYTFRLQSERAFSVSVSRVADGEVLVQAGTKLVQGGL